VTRLLRVLEAADLLGVGRTKLYELLAAGEIESVRIGGCRRVVAASVEAYIARLRADIARRRGA